MRRGAGGTRFGPAGGTSRWNAGPVGGNSARITNNTSVNNRVSNVTNITNVTNVTNVTIVGSKQPKNEHEREHEAEPTR